MWPKIILLLTIYLVIIIDIDIFDYVNNINLWLELTENLKRRHHIHRIVSILLLLLLYNTLMNAHVNNVHVCVYILFEYYYLKYAFYIPK